MPTLVLEDVCPGGCWLKYLGFVCVYYHFKMLVRGVAGGGYPMKVVNGLSWGSIVIGKLQLMDCVIVDVFDFAWKRARLKSPPSIRYRRLMPGLVGGTSFSIAATCNEKQVGTRTHPCLRPPVIGKGSERMLWWQTVPTMSSWRARIRVMKSSGHPKRASTAHMASGDSKGGPRWAMTPHIFAWPPSFFLNFPFKFVWLTYAGLPNAFCKNTGHFVNSARSELCRNS